MKKVVILLFAVVVFSFQMYPQVSGCTDTKANNYNSEATVNNGSCTYNITIYNPPVRFLLPDIINETSGLAFVKGKLWTINDSGGEPVLYAFDTLTGDVVQQIVVEGAKNRDWESLANDDAFIYIGDFGNNSGKRKDLTIYRVKISDIPAFGNASVPSSKITFTYPDYDKNDSFGKDHNFDCEAFIAMDNHLYLFSKNRGDSHSKLYKLPAVPGDYTAELISSFDSRGLITGADIDRVNNEITLTGYVNKTWVPFIWLLYDYQGDDFFSGNKRRLDLLNITATQTEAVAYMSARKGCITSEGNPLFSQTAFNFDCAKWTGSQQVADNNQSQKDFDFEIDPVSVKKNKVKIYVSQLPLGDYSIEVFNESGKLMLNNGYNVSREKSRHKIRIKIHSLVPGNYSVRMTGNGKVVEKKFIVVND